MVSLDLLEGLKRAQRSRLEDQRGTEINFELPDFLKDNKLKSISTASTDPTEMVNSENHRKPLGKAPQPAPRLSIARSNSQNNSIESNSHLDSSNSSSEQSPQKSINSHEMSRIDESDGILGDNSIFKMNGTVPPPLPPKPRHRPVTWLTNGDDKVAEPQNQLTNGSRSPKGQIAERINMLNSAATEKKTPQPRTIYFDRMNSSFV